MLQFYQESVIILCKKQNVTVLNFYENISFDITLYHLKKDIYCEM
jgi:hypothetical protein